MNKLVLNSLFLSALQEKVPKKSVLSNQISELLDMDKVSVYRRLRQDIKFTVDEVGILANHFNISIDFLLETSFDKKMRTQILEMPDLSSTDGTTPESILSFVDFFTRLSEERDSELGAVLNSLPKTLLFSYHNLTRFLIFKWGHYTRNGKAFAEYNAVILPDSFLKMYKQMEDNFKRIKKVYYIWDDTIITNIIKDIKYFESMQKINPSEIEQLKGELFNLLKNMELFASEGQFCGDNIFELYISSINLEGTLICAYSENQRVTIMKMFGIQDIISYERNMSTKTKFFIEQIKKGAIMISSAAEKERTLFFRQQYEVLDQL